MKYRRLLFCVLGAIASTTVMFATDPTGIWKWTAPGRNGQPQETTLKLDLAKDGTLAGTLADRSGTTSIKNVSLKGNQIEFSVVREIPGGKIETTYSGQLNGDTITGTNARPDKSPEAVKANKNRQADWIATREPAKNKG